MTTTLSLGIWQNGIFQGSFTPVSSAAVYEADKTTLATVYSDLAATAMTNPLPTGQSPTLLGVDTGGNVGYAAAPGTYWLLINGSLWFQTTIEVVPEDVTGHFNDPDGHGLKTYVDGNYLPATALGQPAGAAQLDENGVMVTGQVLMTVQSS